MKSLISQKKAAMEMSMGTIVTIVLLVTALIIFLAIIRNIGLNVEENLGLTDKAVKNEINRLFSEDPNKELIVVPESRKIELRKGEDNLGFGFIIRNVNDEEDIYNYVVQAIEVSSSNVRLADADSLIQLGKEGRNIIIPAGSRMNNEIYLRFNVPTGFPPCLIRYQISVTSQKYGALPPDYMDVEILTE
jgi:hypothetical protein